MNAGAADDAPLFGYDQVQRAAMGFVLEDENWPVFLAWLRGQHVSQAAHEWLASRPSAPALRLEWIRRSPDPIVAALAAEVIPDAQR